MSQGHPRRLRFLHALVLSALLLVAVLLPGLASSCAPQNPSVGSQTNWFRRCTLDSECGENSCLCGACTLACDESPDCASLADATCLSAQGSDAEAWCESKGAPAAICLPTCDSQDCPEGSSCSDGVCLPEPEEVVEPEPDELRLTVDLLTRYQSLVGFGASLAYAEDEIAEHPQAEALYDALFRDSGIDVLRMRNRFEPDNSENVATPGEIVAAARARMTEPPILVMTEGSPPPALKLNGSRNCRDARTTCTLAHDAEEAFDYAGIAAHWVASLQAYAEVDVQPDFLSFQNNPNWLPPEGDGSEACRFLPEEGSIAWVEGDEEFQATFAGYREAMAEIASAIADLQGAPALIGPEASSLASALDYDSAVGSGTLEALAVHLYETDPLSNDSEPFIRIAEMAGELPIFQTEMQAEGRETALLLHRALSEGNAAMYLQNDFVSSAAADEVLPSALVRLTETDFELQLPYHAIAHYARRTAPGWRRIAAESTEPTLRLTAWLSPEEDALTLVVVNPESESRTVTLDLAEDLRAQLTASELTLTVFSEQTASADAGELPADGKVEIPGDSLLTIALWQ